MFQRSQEVMLVPILTFVVLFFVDCNALNPIEHIYFSTIDNVELINTINGGSLNSVPFGSYEQPFTIQFPIAIGNNDQPCSETEVTVSFKPDGDEAEKNIFFFYFQNLRPGQKHVAQLSKANFETIKSLNGILTLSTKSSCWGTCRPLSLPSCTPSIKQIRIVKP